MSFNLRQSRVEARPFRRGFRPDGRRRRRQIRVVKRSSTNESERRALFRFTEDLGAAPGAETPMHGCPAVRLANVVVQRASHGDIVLAEKGADGAGSAAEILAHAAPAIACAQRRRRSDLVAHRPAQTSPRDRHEKPSLTASDHIYEKSAAPASQRTRQDRVSTPGSDDKVANRAKPDYKDSSLR